MLAAVLIPLALWLPASGVGKALMIGSVLLLLVVELLNSAVEAVVDRVSLENHLGYTDITCIRLSCRENGVYSHGQLV